MLKGFNSAKIFFYEIIIILFACDVLEILQLWNEEEKNIIPEPEGANLEESNYLSNEEIKEFVDKLKLPGFNDNNRPGLRFLKDKFDKFNL